MKNKREFIDFLLKFAPDLKQEWKGALKSQINKIEELAGRPLPDFYRWFLSKMGHSMGSLANPRRDFSVASVLEAYRDGLVEPNSGFLLIGHETDEVMPMHIFYNLEIPTDDDALIFSQPAEGGGIQREFSTLREMLAWSLMVRFRLYQYPRRCEGSFDGSRNVYDLLDPVLKRLGFVQPVLCGSLTRFYERSDTIMICMVPPGTKVKPYRFFNLSGENVTILRKILDEITATTSLKVEIDEWNPPLTV